MGVFERWDARDALCKEACVAHPTRIDGEHNFLSYLVIGQAAMATNTPIGGSMGATDFVHGASETFHKGFAAFLELPLNEQMAILPQF